MKRIMLTAMVLFWSLFLPGKVAGSKQYAFQQVNTENGLSSTVRCLVVSHDKGYVWIGTKSGIGRFDGYELRKYLLGNITHLIEDREHTIWAITPKGLFRYDEQEDEFTQARDEDHNPILASSICAWTDGVLFGARGRLYKYDYADHKTRQTCPLTPNAKYNITNVHRWDDRTLLCINRWTHALLVDVETGQTRPVPFDSQEIIASLIDRNGNIWVAPYHQGVKCYDHTGRLLHSYNTQNSALQTNVVLSLAENNGMIWIGTDGEGIHVLNPENEVIYHLAYTPGNPNSLPANSIVCLYADPNNNMWAGSVRSGLICIKEVGMKIYADALPGMGYGLSEKVVLSLYRDRTSSMWVGTDGGGINRFDPATRKFHQVKATWGDKVSSITEADEGRLLVSLFSKGIFFFDKRTEKYRPLVIVNDSINAFLCQQGKAVNLFRNTPETILVLSEIPYSYHIGRNEFTPLSLDKYTPMITGSILPIGQEGSATYLHDYKRIYRLNSTDTLLETVYQCSGDTIFNSISLDENGIFWIGSNHGLSYYSMEHRKHTNVPYSLITEVNSLICDKRGKVWIGADGKLFAHIIAQGKLILYGEPDGVIRNEYLEKPRLLSPDGDIYMGGVNGLLCINHTLPDVRTTPPVLRLADVSVGGERMNASISATQSLEVPEHSKPISIKIIGSNKDIFRKLMYRYTLQGMKGQVIYSYQPELTLNGLPAKTYKILASCSTRNGEWTEDYPILELVVLPPWYKSTWFIICCVIIASAGIILAFFSLLRRKERKLKWAMKEHEQQVYEEKVRFLININHELRTPLTLIHAPLKQLRDSIAADDDRYPAVQSIGKQSERMKELLNTVLNVRKMEVGQSTLNIETVELSPWMEQLISDFRQEAGMRGIFILYKPDDAIDAVCFDKGKCTTILTNLLINALKYSPENSRIQVSAKLSDDGTHVRFSIADEGPGLKNVDIDHLFIRFYQGDNSRPGTGIGLSYSKILVEQQGGSIGAYDHGDAPGATFWFELPYDMQPGKVILQPQAYLNELLAPNQETENAPDGGADSVADKRAGNVPDKRTGNVPDEGQEKYETKNKTLLLVDDSQDLTDYLSGALKTKFKNIFIASDGEEALRICSESCPDIVASDIQMSRMNGYELCKHIKENLDISHIPVILLTARNDEESRLLGYKNGADAYLTKPFEVDGLYTVIQNLLKNRDRMRMRYSALGGLPQPQEGTFSSADEKFLEQLNKVISDNLDNPDLGIPLLCKELNASRTSLYKKIKVLAGMGANDYIIKFKIEQAMRLLTDTSLNINEIADRTGFTTARYFSTVFKQYTGCSPTQYKDEHS